MYRAVRLTLSIIMGLISTSEYTNDTFRYSSIISGQTMLEEEKGEITLDDLIITEDFQLFDMTHWVETEINEDLEQSVADTPMYTFISTTPEQVKVFNQEVINLVNKYTSKIETLDIAKDPLWLLAVSNVEYNYTDSVLPSSTIVGWPVDFAEFNKDSTNYLHNFTYKDVEKLGKNYVTKRTGGAIGVFQIERGFGSWTTPIDIANFGLGGRKDAWLEYGVNPDGIGDMDWKLGDRADRWNYADAANIVAGVVNADLKQQKDTHLFNSFDDKYGKVTLLMWGHNTGGGIYSKQDRVDRVNNIVAHIDELRRHINEKQYQRFSYQPWFNDFCDKYELDRYPTRALASYLILEARVKGAW